MGPGFESLKVHQGLNTFFITFSARTPQRHQLNTQCLLRKLTVNLLFVGRTRQLTQYTAYAVCSGSQIRTSESHSRRTSPTQVYGSRDSLLCRTPFRETIINYFSFTNQFRCTIKLGWYFFILLISSNLHRHQLNNQRLLRKRTVNLLFVGRTRRMTQCFRLSLVLSGRRRES